MLLPLNICVKNKIVANCS